MPPVHIHETRGLTHLAHRHIQSRPSTAILPKEQRQKDTNTPGPQESDSPTEGCPGTGLRPQCWGRGLATCPSPGPLPLLDPPWDARPQVPRTAVKRETHPLSAACN